MIWRPIVRKITGRYDVLKSVIRPFPGDVIAANKQLLYNLSRISPKTLRERGRALHG